MSKKSDKKRLRAQLDNLFVDLEQDIELEVQSLESDINAPGWVWECDADGIYTTCSPEVQDFLGIESQKFIGQKVATFKVAPSSQEQIQKALENGAQAQETSAHFLTNKNTQIKVALQILPQEMENGTEAGWRGFAQPIGKFEDQQIVIPENPSETATAGTLQGDLFNKGEIAPPDVNPYTYAISQSLQTGELSLSSGDSKPSVLTAPFRADQDELGLLQILDDDPDRQWSDDERLLVKQVVDQVALALENAQLFQQTQAALKETDVLYQASADLNAAQNYEDVIEVLRKYTIMGENSGMIAVNLFDHPWTETYTPKWFDTLHRWAETPAGQLSQRFQLTNYSPTGEILRREAVMIENMLGAQPNLAAHLRQLYNTGFNIRSAITIPIIIGNQWLGFIEALYRVPTTIPNEELLRLDTLVIQATEKILGFQLNQRIESRRENADRLAKIARRMTEMTNEVELRRYLVQEIFDHINPTSIALLEWSKLENAFRVDLHISAPLEDQINKIQAGDLVSPNHNQVIQDVFNDKQPHLEITRWSEEAFDQYYVLPWFSGDQIQGLIEVRHDARKSPITDLNREYVEGLMLQAASALDRSRLFEQTQTALALTDQQARRLRILNEMSELLSQSTDLNELFDLAAVKTQEIFNAGAVRIGLFSADKKSIEIRSATGELGHTTVGAILPLEGTASQAALRENRIQLLPHSDFEDLGDTQSSIVSPIAVAGEIIGTLVVESSQPEAFSDADENFMRQLLSLLGSIIENRRLFVAIEEALSESEEQGRRLELLNELSREVGQATSMDEIAQIAVSKTSAILSSNRVSMALLNADGASAEILAVHGQEAQTPAGSQIELEGILKEVVEQKQVLVNENVEQDSIGSMQTTMVAPIVINDQAVGTLNVGHEQKNYYSQNDINVMSQIASILSGTIENNQLFSQIQRRSIQLQTAAEVSRSASSILERDRLFRQVTELIQDGFDLYYAGLFIVDESGKLTGQANRWAVLQAGTGEAGKQMLEAGHKLEIGGESMIGQAVATGEARIAFDVGQEGAFFKNPYLPDTRSEMALPLVSRGRVLGALTIQSTQPAAFAEDDITALQTMADQVGNAIENVSLFEETQDRAEELAVLNDMARAFTQTLDIDAVAEITYRYCKRLLGVDNFYMALYNAEEDTVDYRLYVRSGQKIHLDNPKQTGDKGITRWVIQNRKPLHLQNDIDSWIAEEDLQPQGQRAESYLGLPMMKGNQVIGMIAAQSYTTPRQFDSHDLDLLSGVAGQAATAIENAQLFGQTQARARREQILREITAKVHSSADADAILKTAVEEVSNALGRQAFVQLGSKENKQPNGQLKPALEESPSDSNPAEGSKPEPPEFPDLSPEIPED